MSLGRLFAAFSLVLPAFGQYAGPAVLSRGEAPSAMSLPEVDFRPFASFTTGYSTGLAGVSVDQQGNLPNVDAYTLTLGWGVSGTHSWRRTKLGLSYSGSFNHYISQSSFDGLTQSLLLGITHRIARHIVLDIHQTAGVFTRDTGLRGLQQTVPFDPETNFTPTQDFFDNRTIYTSTRATLEIQKSSRLSFGLGGGTHKVFYRSNALTGSLGLNANGDVQYRISRRTTIGGQYMYGHYGFSHSGGSTDYHAVAGSFARALTNRLEFSGFGGVARAEMKFTRSVVVDPVITALFGITGGTETVHEIRTIPYVGARLSQTFARGVAYLSAGHSIVPGNGLFQTSTATTITAGYAYTGLRQWSFNVFGNYTKAESIGSVLGGYSTGNAGLSVGRQIVRNVHFISQVSIRHYSSGTFNKYNRSVASATVGIGYAPGNIPLRTW